MLDSLISASIVQGDGTYLDKLPSFLLDDGDRKAVRWIATYRRKFEKMPTVERFQKSDYGYYFTKSFIDSPLPDLFEETIADKRHRFFSTRFHEIDDIINSGGDMPIQEVIDLGRQLASVSLEEDDSLTSFDRDELYSDELPDGLTFGFDVLDQATGGIQDGEFGLLVARTGVGKTLITCHLALKWAKEGKKVLVVSLEMPAKQMIGRLDAMLGGFNPRLFRTKENPALLALKRVVVDRRLAEIKELGGEIIFPKNKGLTVQALRGLIADKEPDAVIVDGVYLLRSDDNSSASSDWQRLKAASNELKQIAMETSIKMFGTSQLKRTGKDDSFSLEDIAYSDSLGQDTDLVLVANKFAGVTNQLTLEILKNRHGDGFGGTMLKVDWDCMSLTEVDWSVDLSGDDDDDDLPAIKVGGKRVEMTAPVVDDDIDE